MPDTRIQHPGVHYALTDDGVELPVIDLTHPAFEAPDLAAQEQAAAKYLRDMARQARMPRALRESVLWLLSLRSPLVRAIRGASGYLPGMSTYLIKLGPENLGPGYATRVDRAVARALPSLSARLRLRNVATLLAEALGPILQAQPGRPLHLINIAGGPAMDSINTLSLLRKEQPHLLADRAIQIHVLDVDASGASFGRRALAALMAERGPLQGVQAELQHHHYDWSHAQTLADLAGGLRLERSIVACSSEGGLFEYGDDDTVIANLEALRGVVPVGTLAVGSVTRDGPCQQAMRASGVPSPTHLRSREAFATLASRAGWTLDRVIENWMSYDVRLRMA